MQKMQPTANGYANASNTVATIRLKTAADVSAASGPVHNLKIY